MAARGPRPEEAEPEEESMTSGRMPAQSPEEKMAAPKRPRGGNMGASMVGTTTAGRHPSMGDEYVSSKGPSVDGMAGMSKIPLETRRPPSQAPDVKMAPAGANTNKGA